MPLVEAVARTDKNIPVGKKATVAGGRIEAVVKAKQSKGKRKSARGVKQLFTQNNN